MKLDLNEGTTAIKTQATKLHNELMAGRKLPKAGMSNASIEQQMVTAINNEGWNDKFQKAIITSSSWTIEKNSLTSVIMYRYLSAVCTIKKVRMANVITRSLRSDRTMPATGTMTPK